MKLSPQDLFKLNCYLDDKDEERMKYLDEIKNKSTNKKLTKN